ASEHQRRAAAIRARDTGLASLTRSITFHGPTMQNGLMLFAPVYRENGSGGLDRSRNGVIGWTAVALTADAFFRSALSDVEDQVTLTAFDGSASAENLLFSSAPSGPGKTHNTRTTQLELDGSIWTLVWNHGPRFPYLSKTPSAWVAGCTA